MDMRAESDEWDVDACMAFLARLTDIELRDEHRRERDQSVMPVMGGDWYIRRTVLDEYGDNRGWSLTASGAAGTIPDEDTSHALPDIVRIFLSAHPGIVAALGMISPEDRAATVGDAGYAAYLFDHVMLPLLASVSGDLLESPSIVARRKREMRMFLISPRDRMDSVVRIAYMPVESALACMDEETALLTVLLGDASLAMRRFVITDGTALSLAGEDDGGTGFNPIDGRGWAMEHGLTPVALADALGRESHGLMSSIRSVGDAHRRRLLLSAAGLMARGASFADAIANADADEPPIRSWRESGVRISMDDGIVSSVDQERRIPPFPADCMFHAKGGAPILTFAFDMDDLRWLRDDVNTTIPPTFAAMANVFTAVHGMGAPSSAVTTAFPGVSDWSMAGGMFALLRNGRARTGRIGDDGVIRHDIHVGYTGPDAFHHYHADFTTAVELRSADAVRASLALHDIFRLATESLRAANPTAESFSVAFAAKDMAACLSTVASGLPHDLAAEMLLTACDIGIDADARR